MERIELSPYDKKDLLQLIEICRNNKKIFKYDRVDYRKWWEIRLDQLERVIKGYNNESGIFKSSLSGLDMTPLTEDQVRQKYRRAHEKKNITTKY